MFLFIIMIWLSGRLGFWFCSNGWLIVASKDELGEVSRKEKFPFSFTKNFY